MKQYKLTPTQKGNEHSDAALEQELYEDPVAEILWYLDTCGFITTRVDPRARWIQFLHEYTEELLAEFGDPAATVTIVFNRNTWQMMLEEGYMEFVPVEK